MLTLLLDALGILVREKSRLHPILRLVFVPSKLSDQHSRASECCSSLHAIEVRHELSDLLFGERDSHETTARNSRSSSAIPSIACSARWRSYSCHRCFLVSIPIF